MIGGAPSMLAWRPSWHGGPAGLPAAKRGGAVVIPCYWVLDAVSGTHFPVPRSYLNPGAVLSSSLVAFITR
jgi:hypothetical protein